MGTGLCGTLVAAAANGEGCSAAADGGAFVDNAFVDIRGKSRKR